MTREKERFHVKLRLQGEMAKKFNVIKREWGLENKAEVVRMLIYEMYQKINQKRRDNHPKSSTPPPSNFT